MCLLGFVWFLETLSVILCFFLVVSFKGFSDIANKSSLSVTLSCTLPDRSLTGRPRGAGPLPGTLNVLLEGVGAPTGGSRSFVDTKHKKAEKPEFWPDSLSFEKYSYPAVASIKENEDLIESILDSLRL